MFEQYHAQVIPILFFNQHPRELGRVVTLSIHFYHSWIPLNEYIELALSHQMKHPHHTYHNNQLILSPMYHLCQDPLQMIEAVLRLQHRLQLRLDLLCRGDCRKRSSTQLLPTFSLLTCIPMLLF